MMMNLFSSFDPVSSMYMYMYIYLFMFIVLFFTFSLFWVEGSHYTIFVKGFFDWLKFEVKSVKMSYLYSILYLSIFFIVLLFNVVGMFPYTFVWSSQISMNYGFSIWILYLVILNNWCNKPLDVMSNLVPSGTPFILVFMMVIVETISDWIRPITLSIRLSANLTAGHLILSLFGDFLVNSLNSLYFSVFFIYMIMFILEFMIGVIQSYVFFCYF
uniref:ATP synthase subunit a n=1 Tax=Polyascus gregaria TaxID=238043 RepID=H8ZWM9_9CRUS|nr:ATPase subunit 6 [Polyascus gregaria]